MNLYKQLLNCKIYIILLTLLIAGCNMGAPNSNNINNTNSMNISEHNNNKSPSNTGAKTSYPAGTLIAGYANGSVTAESTLLPGIKINESAVTCMATDSIGNVYVGTSGGNIWKYNASVASWTLLANKAPDGSAVMSVTVDSTGHVYAGTKAGNIWKYSASIDIWILFGQLDGSMVMYVAADSIGNVYVGTDLGNIWKHDQSNNSWILLANKAPDGSAVMSIAVDSTGTTIYTGTTSGNVWEFNTNESSWISPAKTSPFKSSVLSVAIFPGGSEGTLYAGTKDGNLWELYNDVWQPAANRAPDGSPIYSISIDSLGNIYVGTRDGNVWEIVGGWAYTWTLVGNGSPDRSSVYSVITDSTRNVYAGTENGNVWEFIESSNSWTLLANKSSTVSNSNKADQSSGISASNPITAVAGGMNGDVIIVGTESGIVCQYIESTQQWEVLGQGTVDILDKYPSITSLAHNSTTNITYATTQDGWLWQYNESSNQWKQVYQNANSNLVIVDSNNLVYRGTNDGYVKEYIESNNTWITLGNGQVESQASVLSLTVDGAGNIYAGDQNGNLFTTSVSDSSATWTEVTCNSTGIHSPIIALTADPVYNIITAGTKNGNVWQFQNDDLNDCVQGPTLPQGSLTSLAIVPERRNEGFSDLIYASNESGVWELLNNAGWTNTGYGNGASVSALAVTY